MNGFQRIKNALDGAWPDRRPVMLHNFMHAVKEAGFTMAQYRSSPKCVAESLINATEKYGLDGVLVDIDTATLAGAIGAKVDFPADAPARCHGPKLDSIEKVRELAPVDISNNERVQIWLESSRRIKAYFGNEIFVRGNCDQAPFSLASMIVPIEELMFAILCEDKVPLVNELLEYCTNVGSQFIQLMAATGVDMVSNGDSVGGPDVVSPEMYKKFALPYEKKIVETAKACGKYHMLHICGKTDQILPYMVESNTDCLELDYKTNINEIVKWTSNKTAFSGNIDPTGVMMQGTPHLVQETLVHVLKSFVGNPRLIINAGCALPPDTPNENIIALVKRTQEYGI